MFVKFDCGCVGLSLGTTSVVVKPCDSDTGGYTFYSRDMGGKNHSPLSEEDQKEVINDLGRLVAEGYHLHQIRWLLQST